MNVVQYFVEYHLNNYTEENLKYLLYAFTICDFKRYGNDSRWKALMFREGFGLAWEQASWRATGGSVRRDDDYNISKHPKGDFDRRVKVYEELLLAYNRQDR